MTFDPSDPKQLAEAYFEVKRKLEEAETKLRKQAVTHLSEMGQCLEEHHWAGICEADQFKKTLEVIAKANAMQIDIALRDYVRGVLIASANKVTKASHIRNVILEEAARAMEPMLRSMLSRGQAAEIIRSLKK